MPAASDVPAARRLDVQGLRGLAVLLVVLFHAGVTWFRGAFVAVDVFFVLSGFFLMTSLTRRLVEDDAVRFRDVYARRAWRLLPTLALVLLVTLAMSALLFAPIDRATVADNVRPVAMFVGNLAFAADGVNYFRAGENPVLHTWALGVEYQLALLLPAIVALFAAVGRWRAGTQTGHERRLIVMQTVLLGIVGTGAISFAISALFSGASPMWAYFGPHTRLWAFCAGAATSFVAGGGQSVFGGSRSHIGAAQVIGLVAIAVPAIFYDRSMSYPGAIALAPVAGTALLLATGDAGGGTPIGRLLSLRPLVWLGGVSYAWYLWHWPLMVLGGAFAPTIGAWGRLAWGAAALVSAALTHTLLEQRFDARKLPYPLSSWPMLSAIGVAAAVALLAQVAAVQGRRDVANSVHRVYAAARGDRMDHACWGRAAGDPQRAACAFGDANSATAIALLGDSHAEHWLGGLDRAGREHGWRIEAHVMGGCPVADFSGLLKAAAARGYRKCSQFREAALSALVAQRPRAVVLVSFDSYIQKGDVAESEYQVNEATWTEGLRRTYARLDAAGITTVVIRGTPRIPFDVPTCLSRRAAGLPFARDCTYVPDREFLARGQAAQNRAARGLRHVHFVDMNDQLCGAARCPTERNGLVMFTDNNHLTASFTRSLAAILGERIEDRIAR